METKQRSIMAGWNEVERKLERFHNFLILFDYDGTLTPISKLPSQARLSNSTKKSLLNLSRLSNCTVGIVSGRSLLELRRLVRIPGIIYVGNHGLEIESDGWSFVHPSAKAKKTILQKLAKRLSRTLARYPGAFVENKGLTLSVHYRRVKPGQRKSLLGFLKKESGVIERQQRLLVRQGRKVFEILPLHHWNKGTAVLWLKNIVPANSGVLYVGDDVTDEDAFRVLRNKGISIRVGAKKSSATHYYLNRQSEVARFIKKLLEFLSRREKPGEGR